MVTHVTPEACAAACYKETSFPCRSFDYDNAAKKCFLSKAYRDTVSVSVDEKSLKDYYELSKFALTILIGTKLHC